VDARGIEGSMSTSPSSLTRKPRGWSTTVSGKTDSFVTLKLALAFSRNSTTGGLIDCASSEPASTTMASTSAAGARCREGTARDTSGSPAKTLMLMNGDSKCGQAARGAQRVARRLAQSARARITSVPE
jgi:hypothetical protein